MHFHLSFDPPSLEPKLKWGESVLLIGSCFTEHMNRFLQATKFSCCSNPNGTLFNPISMFNALVKYADNQHVEFSALTEHNGLWSNWQFHSSFSDPDPKVTLQKINASITAAHRFLEKADWVILTLGSGWVYEVDHNEIVANCHKHPADRFTKRLLHPEEVSHAFQVCYDRLKQFNPRLKFIVTISPVRHKRDGLIENNRGKSVLFLAVDQMIQLPDVHYFPAFELVVDDLRDYRFFTEDLVHPNEQAAQYVWDKFLIAAIDGETREGMERIGQLNTALQHRPLHPESVEHKQFKQRHLIMVHELSKRYPGLDFSLERAHFSRA